MFVPIAIFSTHDRHSRAYAPGRAHTRTYYPEDDPGTDYNYRLVVISVFVLERYADTARIMFSDDFTALLVGSVTHVT